MGYQNKTLTCNGVNDFVVRTFRTVGQEAKDMTLGQLTASDDMEGGVYWLYSADILSTLKPNGSIDKEYTYVGPNVAAALAEADITATPGWYLYADAVENDFTNPQNEIPLAMTQGFMITAQSDDITINFNGEVLPKGWCEIAMTCNGVNDFTGNITPSNITFANINASDDMEGGVYWLYSADIVSTLKPNGSIDKEFTYVGPNVAAALAEADITATPGWYLYADAVENDFSNPQNKEPFTSGKCFMATAQSDDVCLYVVSALGAN